MKKNFVFLTLLLTSVYAFGQGPRNMSREQIKSARIAFLTNRLELTEESAQKFWPIFNDFENKKEALRESYNEKKRKVATTGGGLRNLSDEAAKEMLSIYMDQRQSELDLEKEYVSKFAEAIPPQKVWMVIRIDGEFRRHLMQRLSKERNENFRGSRRRDGN